MMLKTNNGYTPLVDAGDEATPFLRQHMSRGKRCLLTALLLAATSAVLVILDRLLRIDHR